MFSLLLSYLAPAAFAAAPFISAEYSPMSRGDLTWTAESQGSGLIVGELDGFVNPGLKAHVGAWVNASFAFSVNLGTARILTTTWVDDIFHQQHWGVVRPGLDLRFAPWNTDPRLPRPWLTVGTYVDIASSRDVSNGYTDSEQEEASGIAAGYVNRLRGQGARVGFGVDQRLVGGLSLGVLATTVWHRNAVITETTQTTSTWTSGDVSFLVTFDWPAPLNNPTDDDP